jgi:hypothetical protein
MQIQMQLLQQRYHRHAITRGDPEVEEAAASEDRDDDGR